jgi:hypothetical protein
LRNILIYDFTFMSSRIRLRPRLASLLLLAFAGCVTDGVTRPVEVESEGTITVDASSSWRYVSLADSAVVTPTPSAQQSGAWDIAFNGTSVTLNGGAAGPGGVEAACICQNASATNDEVLLMTAASELADFEAVTSVPAGLTWMTDQLTPAIAGWYEGTGAAATAATDQSWLVRLADGVGYASLRVAAIAGPSASNAGTITLEYALQATAASALGAPQTLEVDLTTPGAKLVDLAAGSVSTTSATWDLRVEGFTIRTNGGISGPGQAGAAVSTTPFETTTTAVTQPNAYRTDVYAGIFGSSRYYRYNAAGDHRISPTFDVYLLRRADAVYKLQVIGYYSETGAPRHVTMRWQRIAE